MIRVLLAEDVRMLREAPVEILDLADDIRGVTAGDTGDTIVPTALHTQPDLAVIDIELPRLDGISATARLRSDLYPASGTSRRLASEKASPPHCHQSTGLAAC